MSNDEYCCFETPFFLCRRGVVMCRDNNTTDWIYVIKTGSCRVLKTLTAVKPNIPGLHKHTYSEDSPVTLPHQKSLDYNIQLVYCFIVFSHISIRYTYFQV